MQLWQMLSWLEEPACLQNRFVNRRVQNACAAC